MAILIAVTVINASSHSGLRDDDKDGPMHDSEIKSVFTPISYTPEQAAAATGRSRSRIFKAIKEKELTARKDGKATILEADELRRWVGTFRTVGRQPVAA